MLVDWMVTRPKTLHFQLIVKEVGVRLSMHFRMNQGINK